MAERVVIREATPADAGALAAIERSTPLVFAGNESLAIDRGEDYFAATRLMGGATVMIGEVDGEPGGAVCGAIHPVLLGGVPRRMLYVHHARILPRCQGIGLGRKLSMALMERAKAEGYDSPYWYISPTNEHSQAFARSSPGKWSFGPVWLTLPCAANAGPAHGRPATPGDAAGIAHILNACHAGEEMFLPYTAESFARRVERDPQQYGWEHILVGDGAVAGIWPEGEWISVRHTDALGRETESRGAAVLDYGFLPGAGGELRNLLRAWCSWLDAQGMAEVNLFTSRGTRAWPLFESMEVESSTFDFWTPSLPEPGGAASRGLYVDHIYF